MNNNIFEKSAFSIPKWFCHRSGAPPGSLWELLGGSGELSGASRSSREVLQIHLGILFGLVCSPLAAEDGLGWVLGPSMSFFLSSPSLLGSIWSSQTDPHTFEKNDFLS